MKEECKEEEMAIGAIGAVNCMKLSFFPECKIGKDK